MYLYIKCSCRKSAVHRPVPFNCRDSQTGHCRSFSSKGLLKAFDVKLLHLKDGIHDSIRFLRIPV